MNVDKQRDKDYVSRIVAKRGALHAGSYPVGRPVGGHVEARALRDA